jgi:hypothetical protein
MPDVAHACVAAMADGHDVELPVAPWRRPGLTKAIGAELEAHGNGHGSWRFVEPAADEDEPTPAATDARETLGWGGGPVAGARGTLPTASLPPGAAVRAAPLVVPAGPRATASPHAAGMMLGAYTILASAQPVMADGLRPGPLGRVRPGSPITQRSSMASALAELADLDLDL